MFAGGDNKSQMSGTTKNYQSTQWSLNPSSYQNVENDQVDWAQLAQQWIQMKDTCPPEYDLGAPPPPPLCFQNNKFEEKGEADMEMDKDDEPLNSASFNNFQSHQSQSSSWKNSGWNTWTNPNMVESPIQTITTQISRPPLLQSPATNFSQSSFNSTTSNFPPTVSSSNSYWNSSSRNRYLPSNSNNSTNELKSYSSEHRGGSEDMIGSDDEEGNDDSSQTIDAAKRKTLPVWIREGLEKMEREKLKEEQREKELKQREAMLLRRKIAEEEALKELASESNIPRKSKFDSDSDDDDKEIQPNVSKPDSKSEEKKKSKSPEMLKPYRTREEIIQDMMLAVRKNLTEILLEVTNEEIFDIVKECVAKNRKKAPTAQVRKSALSSITGGLGLGIYSNSTDEDESSDSGEEDLKVPEKNNESDVDSDYNLQESIKRRKTAFEKTSREIEAQLAEEEAREERKRRERELKQNAKNSDDESSDQDDKSKRKNQYREGETTHDKNNMKYGRKPREKKPSRFSDPRDTVRNMQTHISMVATNRTITKEDINDQRQEKDDLKLSRSSEESHRSNSSKRKKSKKDKKSHKKKKAKYSESENSDLDDNSSLQSSRSRDHYSRSVSRSEDSRSHRDYHSSSSYSKNHKNKSRSRSRSHDRHSRRSKSPSSKDRKRHRY